MSMTAMASGYFDQPQVRHGEGLRYIRPAVRHRGVVPRRKEQAEWVGVAGPPSQSAKRFERLLLILAWAYVLPVGLWLWVRAKYPARKWCSNNRPDDCSAYTVYRMMLGRLRIRSATTFTALAEVANWG